MAKIISRTETQTTIDANGNVSSTTKETTNKIERIEEPDYIKLYTKMWCEFNNIPMAYRELFLQLALRMSYCKYTPDGIGGQLVNTGGSRKREIMDALGWKERMYQRGLQELCKCNAIRKTGRGEYQINPQYAGRGEWKYNPNSDRGGVADLVATFRFKDRQSNVQIIWSDDGTDNDFNKIYRNGLQVRKEDNTVLKSIKTDAVPEFEEATV